MVECNNNLANTPYNVYTEIVKLNYSSFANKGKYNEQRVLLGKYPTFLTIAKQIVEQFYNTPIADYSYSKLIYLLNFSIKKMMFIDRLKHNNTVSSIDLTDSWMLTAIGICMSVDKTYHSEEHNRRFSKWVLENFKKSGGKHE